MIHKKLQHKSTTLSIHEKSKAILVHISIPDSSSAYACLAKNDTHTTHLVLSSKGNTIPSYIKTVGRGTVGTSPVHGLWTISSFSGNERFPIAVIILILGSREISAVWGKCMFSECVCLYVE